MLNRNEKIKEDAWRRMDDLLKAGDAVGNLNSIGRETSDELAKKIETKYSDLLSGQNFGESSQISAIQKILGFLRATDDQGNKLANSAKTYTLEDLQNLKNSFKNSANWAKKAPGIEDPAADIYKDVTRIIDDSIESYLDKATMVLKGPLSEEFTSAKNTYRLASATENILDNALLKEQGLNTFGLSSRIIGSGGTSAAIGGIAGTQIDDDSLGGGLTGALALGALGAGGAKLADKYGPQLAANIGKGLTKINEANPLKIIPEEKIEKYGKLQDLSNKTLDDTIRKGLKGTIPGFSELSKTLFTEDKDSFEYSEKDKEDIAKLNGQKNFQKN